MLARNDTNFVKPHPETERKGVDLDSNIQFNSTLFIQSVTGVLIVDDDVCSLGKTTTYFRSYVRMSGRTTDRPIDE